jgi:lysophospholipid acyltransferase (LPLAT)-like uncharacterized protein
MKLSARQTRWIAGPLALFIRALGRTWRIRKQGFPSPGPDSQFIEAFLHGHMVPYTFIYRDEDQAVIVSDHRDGQIIANIAERMGAKLARGSSTRGGVRAYLMMLKTYRDTGWVVTPDGPRGPIGSVQEGIIKLASDAGRAIRPHGIAVASAKRLKSWDEFIIPYPFTRVVEFVGDPIHVPAKIDRAQRKEFAKELERRLSEANHEAEVALSKWLQRPAPSVSNEEHNAPPT